MKLICTIVILFVSSLLWSQDTPKCPVNITWAGVWVKNSGQYISITERFLRVDYQNVSRKNIVALKFGAVFFNQLDEPYDSSTGYLDDEVLRWEQKRDAEGKPQKPKTGIWTIYQETASKADAWLIKAKFADGEIWEDDGSHSCNAGLPSVRIRKGTGLAEYLKQNHLEADLKDAASDGGNSVGAADSPLGAAAPQTAGGTAADIRSELTIVGDQLRDAEKEQTRFGEGLIKTQIQHRLATLRNTQALLTSQLADVESGAKTRLPDLARIAEIDVRLKKARASLADASVEDQKYSGGLIKALIEQRIATIEDTIAALEQQRLTAKFGLGTPRPNATPSTAGIVNITTVPNGADIFLDGVFVGSSPAKLKLTPGNHSVKVSRAKYRDWKRDFSVLDGSEVHLNAVLDTN